MVKELRASAGLFSPTSSDFGISGMFAGHLDPDGVVLL